MDVAWRAALHAGVVPVETSLWVWPGLAYMLTYCHDVSIEAVSICCNEV